MYDYVFSEKDQNNNYVQVLVDNINILSNH